ncbi:hypothetical protein ACQJBY_011294 [Aegilops geniculata]
METLGYFERLKSLDLFCVRITEEGLWKLLSKSFSLERLDIFSCNEIICLKIPCTLQKLNLLIVTSCQKIQVIDISAPNLFTFHYVGFPPEIYIGDSSQLTEVHLSSLYPSRIISYGRAKLPSIASNVERLTLLSYGENVNTPMLPDKLLHLKSLKIVLNGSGPCSPVYDTFSLASFLDASPALESFISRIERNAIIHCYDAGGDAYLRGKSAYQHDHLKRVMIAGFRSAKSLIKLVIHILESSPSLERLTLDTTPGGHGRKLGDTSICSAARMWGKCSYMRERELLKRLTELLRLRVGTSLGEFHQLLNLRSLSPVGNAIPATSRWMLVWFVVANMQVWASGPVQAAHQIFAYS